MARALYNEIDPYAAQWLRNLIEAGHIAPGDVDERSVDELAAADLRGYTQVHFFAGIGVWSYALRLAGWPDDRPVWTGSCPCQPFSAAGKGAGFADERHLWPAFHHLIRECRPPVVFGEQVASKDGLEWLDLVQADLEGTGYASAAVDLCAAGVGAPHIRQRLYWVADADNGECTLLPYGQRQERLARSTNRSSIIGLGEPVRVGRQGTSDISGALQSEEFESRPQSVFGEVGECGPTHGHWRDADWLFCRDGKWRPVEPGTFPLAHGAAARVGRLRAYGNAIVPQVAQAFIEAYLSC